MQVQQQWKHSETQQIPRAPPNTKPNLISFPVSEEFHLLPFCLFQANRLQQMGNDHRVSLGETCGWKSAAVKQNPAEGRSVLVSLTSGVVTSGLVRPQCCFTAGTTSPQRAKSVQAIYFSQHFFFFTAVQTTCATESRARLSKNNHQPFSVL